MFSPAPDGLPDPDTAPAFYAGVPLKRLVAWALDAAAILVLAVLAVPFTAFTGVFWFPLLWLGIGFAYRAITLAAASATPGMRLLGIELRGRDGHLLDATTAVLHTAGYTLSISTLLVQAVSVGLMATGARGQGLTDLVLGTAAINRPATAL